MWLNDFVPVMDGRQPLPNRVTSELPVSRPRSPYPPDPRGNYTSNLSLAV